MEVSLHELESEAGPAITVEFDATMNTREITRALNQNEGARKTSSYNFTKQNSTYRDVRYFTPSPRTEL